MKRLVVVAVTTPLLVSALASAAATSAAHAATIAAPKQCISVAIPGYGQPRFVKHVAHLSARIAWQHRIANGKFGPQWAKWSKASRRTVSCLRDGQRWKCTARAKPCRV